MVELVGTEKQVKWANDIREKGIEICKKHSSLKRMLKKFETETSAKWFIDGWKGLTSQYKDDYEKYRSLADADWHLQCMEGRKKWME